MSATGPGPWDIVDRLCGWARDTPWCEWLELGGSLAAGRGDQYSDVDAGLGVGCEVGLAAACAAAVEGTAGNSVWWYSRHRIGPARHLGLGCFRQTLPRLPCFAASPRFSQARNAHSLAAVLGPLTEGLSVGGVRAVTERSLSVGWD
jgi:hypothetical protein